MEKPLVLKISGEALCAPGQKGIGAEQLELVARQVRDAREADPSLTLAIVVGGGNFLRGREMSEQGVERVTADYMGMIATIINGLALQSSLEGLGVATRVLSAIPVHDVCETFIRRRALRHLEKGRVVIFVGGTGNPYFSTDSAAALRAVEIGAGCLLKGTKVRGVHSEDPSVNPDAEFYDEITFTEVLEKDLRVMDSTAISLCRENDLPISVFDMTVDGNIRASLRGERLGTLVRS